MAFIIETRTGFKSADLVIALPSPCILDVWSILAAGICCVKSAWMQWFSAVVVSGRQEWLDPVSLLQIHYEHMPEV
jgi:hypothetical protein